MSGRWFILAVLVCSGAAFAEGVFEGLPVVGERVPAASDGFRFVILGDKTSGGEGKWPIFDRAVDSINLLEPEFVITVGDQIPGHMQERALWNEEWAEYRSRAERLDMPLVVIPGNHDIANTECYKFWKEDLGPTYFSFDYEGCHFLVLNTEEERFDGRGPVWQSMMKFMEEDLARSAGSRHTFVLFHKPMWDDPRYTEDWARLEKALGERKCTIVAGHEHYLMSERRGEKLLVVQSATGGGIKESALKDFGAFHSFAYVTVNGDEVTYAVVEPDGRLWPVDVAPASFRKAIGHEVVQLDAEPPEVDGETVWVRGKAVAKNVFNEPIAMELSVEGGEAGWNAVNAETKPVSTLDLQPGHRVDVPLAFRVAAADLPHPPEVSWRVKYKGAWVQNDSMPMVQENVAPLYPAANWRSVPEWSLVGPFALGTIDTSKLPRDPNGANAKFFERFGPEDGYDAERVYEGGRKWFPAESVGRGLLNFNALMGTVDQALGYALCGVYSPEAQATHAVMFGDNFCQAVLNGELLEDAQSFGSPAGFTYVPLRLDEGWNTLVVKLINNKADWFVRVLVADPKGNLKFARTPESGGPE